MSDIKDPTITELRIIVEEQLEDPMIGSLPRSVMEEQLQRQIELLHRVIQTEISVEDALKEIKGLIHDPL